MRLIGRMSGASAPSGLCCKESIIRRRFAAGASPLRGDRAIRFNSSTFPAGKSAVFPLLSLARFGRAKRLFQNWKFDRMVVSKFVRSSRLLRCF
jgi:hypothetical protein